MYKNDHRKYKNDHEIDKKDHEKDKCIYSLKMMFETLVKM